MKISSILNSRNGRHTWVVTCGRARVVTDDGLAIGILAAWTWAAQLWFKKQKARLGFPKRAR